MKRIRITEVEAQALNTLQRVQMQYAEAYGSVLDKPVRPEQLTKLWHEREAADKELQPETKKAMEAASNRPKVL